MQYNPAMPDVTPFLSIANRLLVTQPQLAARLARHAGRQVVIRLPGLSLNFAFSEEGRLEQGHAGEPAATEILVSPALLIGLLTTGSEALSGAEVRGDGVLANDIAAVVNGIDWALALRPYLGDVVAARVAQGLSAFSGWRQKVGEAFGRSLAEYATYEAGMLADAESIRLFVAEIDELRDAAARLEARIQILERSRGTG
jgi:ubiquinone biosynthesis protein UbiJ